MNKIMLLGTASSVGKSTVATAICRYYKNQGLTVAPFKALNISLNSYVTERGLEMGRAQVVQAEACELIPAEWMNPVLLKPSGNMKTQVIVKGKVHCNMDAYHYKELNKELREVIRETFLQVTKNYDLMVLEGSGSCAEINLKDTDIANMAMAKMADTPVILVADIDRGGVFASVVGTLMLLDEEEKARVKGVIINKFRGNPDYFKPAMKQLEDIIKIPVLGVLPYFKLDIEDEDSVTERMKNKASRGLDIAIIRLPYMSNFTDFNALERLGDVSVRYVKEEGEVGKPDLLIIPGSKNTIADLRAIKENGLFDKIKTLRHQGIRIFGICGGYQMLGATISDQEGVEGEITEEQGFDFLEIYTTFNKDKITKQTKGSMFCKSMPECNGMTVYGYEIHNGISTASQNALPFIKDDEGNIVGVCSQDERVMGTYLHGIFDEGDFATNFINRLKVERGLNISKNEILNYKVYKLQQYDALSKILEENIDIEKLNEIVFNTTTSIG